MQTLFPYASTLCNIYSYTPTSGQLEGPVSSRGQSALPSETKPPKHMESIPLNPANSSYFISKKMKREDNKNKIAGVKLD